MIDYFSHVVTWLKEWFKCNLKLCKGLMLYDQHIQNLQTNPQVPVIANTYKIFYFLYLRIFIILLPVQDCSDADPLLLNLC